MIIKIINILFYCICHTPHTDWWCNLINEIARVAFPRLLGRWFLPLERFWVLFGVAGYRVFKGMKVKEIWGWWMFLVVPFRSRFNNRSFLKERSFSLKKTLWAMYTLPVWCKHLYSLWVELYPMKKHFKVWNWTLLLDMVSNAGKIQIQSFSKRGNLVGNLYTR